MDALVSVIIPVYKVELYLDRCVQSVVDQSYKNLEIILVDDGSPDDCPRMCDEWTLKDERIKVIHKENGGLGFARNDGIEVSHGAYIMFVDSDDYLHTDAVRVLYDRLIADGSDMAVGKHVDVYETGTKNDNFCKWMKDDVITPRDILTYLGDKNYISVVAWGKLYRRHIFDEIRFPFNRSAEDLWVFPQVVEKCEKISVVDAVVCYYYQRSTSIMHSRDEGKIYDDTHSKLRAVRFLIDRELYKSAARWFSFVIYNELRLKDRKSYQKLNRHYLESHHVRILLREISVKDRVKWLILQFPFSNAAFRLLQKIKK